MADWRRCCPTACRGNRSRTCSESTGSRFLPRSGATRSRSGSSARARSASDGCRLFRPISRPRPHRQVDRHAGLRHGIAPDHGAVPASARRCRAGRPSGRSARRRNRLGRAGVGCAGSGRPASAGHRHRRRGAARRRGQCAPQRPRRLLAAAARRDRRPSRARGRWCSPISWPRRSSRWRRRWCGGSGIAASWCSRAFPRRSNRTSRRPTAVLACGAWTPGRVRAGSPWCSRPPGERLHHDSVGGRTGEVPVGPARPRTDPIRLASPRRQGRWAGTTGSSRAL